MKNKIILVLMSAVLLLGSSFALADKTQTPAEKTKQELKVVENAATKPEKPKFVEKKINPADYTAVKSLDVVANPGQYVGKNIKMDATFDKFSTLGLDYTPAYRKAEEFISFLIKRDDVTDHTIPLSEMKIFLLRDYAEKFIDLESGDKITIYGHVFSTALGDPWVDVDKLIITDKKNKTADKTKSQAKEPEKQ